MTDETENEIAAAEVVVVVLVVVVVADEARADSAHVEAVVVVDSEVVEWDEEGDQAERQITESLLTTSLQEHRGRIWRTSFERLEMSTIARPISYATEKDWSSLLNVGIWKLLWID